MGPLQAAAPGPLQTAAPRSWNEALSVGEERQHAAAESQFAVVIALNATCSEDDVQPSGHRLTRLVDRHFDHRDTAAGLWRALADEPVCVAATASPSQLLSAGDCDRASAATVFGARSIGYGYTYAVPYYVYPSDDPGYYGSGGGGSYLYFGPPEGQAPPAEQTLHIIVDTAPTHPAPQDQAVEEPSASPPPAAQEVRPGVPTILVFRDGHKQDVINYAIMGQTVYVFDNRTKKVALADLDVPATIKANDDQGVEFHVPKSNQSAKPAKVLLLRKVRRRVADRAYRRGQHNAVTRALQQPGIHPVSL